MVGEIVMWFGSPAKIHHLALMQAELRSFERCALSPEPDVAETYRRAAENTRQAIQQLERIAQEQGRENP